MEKLKKALTERNLSTAINLLLLERQKNINDTLLISSRNNALIKNKTRYSKENYRINLERLVQSIEYRMNIVASQKINSSKEQFSLKEANQYHSISSSIINEGYKTMKDLAHLAEDIKLKFNENGIERTYCYAVGRLVANVKKSL